MERKQKFKKVALLLVLVFACIFSKANNVAISNVSLTAINDTAKKINFSLSWDQSWRTSTSPNNHDAIWLFVKYKDCASGNWRHVRFSDTLTHHTVNAPLELFVDKKCNLPAGQANGIFARRSADGSGNISNVAISLVMANLPPGEQDYRIFGIEMVWIPTGSFYLGDGVNTNRFKVGATDTPFQVTTDDAIAVGAAPNLSATGLVPLAILAPFPTGYDSIYCMKYEISQGQYADFLNTLNQDQATVRAYTGLASGNNITGVWPNYASSTPDRANNHLAWQDLVAYLDWACLRPMSEMEYEKICRGPAAPIRFEYAWGTSSLIQVTNATLVGGTDGQPNESFALDIIAGYGVANMGNVFLRPTRNGFAATPTTNRLQSGATFYGVMEMTGNVWELVITTNVAAGQSFNSANLGDGQLAITPTPGQANVASWPSTAAAATAGFGLRGGSWQNPIGANPPAVPSVSNGQISERTNANWADAARYSSVGGRGVR